MSVYGLLLVCKQAVFGELARLRTYIRPLRNMGTYLFFSNATKNKSEKINLSPLIEINLSPLIQKNKSVPINRNPIKPH
jgi:hypothetical protein